MPRLVVRPVPDAGLQALLGAGVHPVVARVLAARGVASLGDNDHELATLLPFTALLNAEAMAARLADAIVAGKRLLIVGDYDADGATAAAVGCLALRGFGATVDTLVPNRFEYGYGLTPEIVRIAAARSPDIIITVDNGIASIDGVDAANRHGIEVLVTDHHLPGATLPAATSIVNPNQRGCPFPSKNLAGVGVMFYVMLALRAELRRRGAFGTGTGPNLASLLDLVALGTVADVVRLDRNTRTLVAQGLRRIRDGRARPGVMALLRAAGRDPAGVTAEDLGFVVGPRLNAAGRLEDMAQGIECLMTDDTARADALAGQLSALNRDRRAIEAGMETEALAQLSTFDPGDSASITLHDPAWHPGVVGLLASRLRERFHRPAFCFAGAPGGEIKGSGRSIDALHLRDALDLVDRAHPGLLLRFGGHAAAAGASLLPGSVDAFRAAFEATAQTLLSDADLDRVIETDGALRGNEMALPVAELLRKEVWGRGFAPPLFADRFEVEDQRVVGGAHLRLRLRPAGTASPPVTSMLFRHADRLPARIEAVFRLDVNEWNGVRSLQLVVEHWEAAHG